MNDEMEKIQRVAPKYRNLATWKVHVNSTDSSPAPGITYKFWDRQRDARSLCLLHCQAIAGRECSIS
jgi:hypothetical protein